MIRRTNQREQEDGRSFLHIRDDHEGQQNKEGIHQCVRGKDFRGREG